MMPARVFIDGLAIGGYRSFGPDLQKIGPFSGVNLFAGRNNSGKSNILRFIRKHLPEFWKAGGPRTGPITFSPTDHHNGETSNRSIGIGLRTDDESLSRILDGKHKHELERLKSTLKLSCFDPCNDLSWFRYMTIGANSNAQFPTEYIDAVANTHSPYNETLVPLVTRLGGNPHNADRNVLAITLIDRVSPKSRELPETVLIPAFREIKAVQTATGEQLQDGTGLIAELANLKSHPVEHPEYGERFRKIERFFQSVVGESDWKLHIPRDESTICVNMNGKWRDLDSLGTGIHQTVILAAMGTVHENKIVCIEEPELHLHPILQRKLIRFLATETNNQYFIATHSAHLLDCRIPNVVVSAFRVSLQDGCTLVDSIMTSPERWEVCRDLGYRASDLVQANCIIWVEGPSDRIYLNHWLHSVDATLCEGIHYAIMFYGGSLLKHISCDENEIQQASVEDLVELRKLNRNMGIIIDSDFSAPSDVLGQEKLRVVNEFSTAPGFAWITKGRTIENYLTPELWRHGFLAAHPNSEKHLGASGQFEHIRIDCGAFNKMRMARAVAEKPADLSPLDLEERIKQVVCFVKECNPEH